VLAELLTYVETDDLVRLRSIAGAARGARVSV